MAAIPAIDLIDGRCVRLTQGSFDTVTFYSEKPTDVARSYADAGAERLHVVDLDAVRGQENNRKTIAALRKAFPGVLDVGGGIRTLSDARSLISLGVDLVVVGTVLAHRPGELAFWVAELGSVVVAGIDARDGEVKVAGWQSSTTVRAAELAVSARQLGLVEIIYTDISRDGTLGGPNVPEALAIARASGIPVVVSGGIGNMDHIRTIADSPHEGLSGVILGKALYEKHLDLTNAIHILKGGGK